MEQDAAAVEISWHEDEPVQAPAHDRSDAKAVVIQVISPHENGSTGPAADFEDRISSVPYPLQTIILKGLEAKDLCCLCGVSKRFSVRCAELPWDQFLFRLLPSLCWYFDHGNNGNGTDYQHFLRPEDWRPGQPTRRAPEIVAALMKELARPEFEWWRRGRAVTTRLLFSQWHRQDDIDPAYSRIRHIPPNHMYPHEWKYDDPRKAHDFLIVEGRRSAIPPNPALLLDLQELKLVQISSDVIPEQFVKPHLRVRPFQISDYELRNKRLSRKYQAAVTGQLGFAIALTCLLVGLKMDGLASHSWFAALCPLLVWLFTGCIYIAWHRSHSRTLDEAVFTVIATLAGAAQLIVFFLRLDGTIDASFGRVLSPVWALYGFAAVVGFLHGLDHLAFRRRNAIGPTNCAVICGHITTVLTTQSLYLLAFGPVFLVCLLCALRGDGTGATSASWFAILSPIHLYELFACLLLRVHMRNLADPLVIHAMYRDQQYRAMSLDYSFYRWHSVLGVPFVLSLLAAHIVLCLKLDGSLDAPWLAALSPLMLFGLVVMSLGLLNACGSRTRILADYNPTSLSPEQQQVVERGGLHRVLDWPRALRCWAPQTPWIVWPQPPPPLPPPAPMDNGPVAVPFRIQEQMLLQQREQEAAFQEQARREQRQHENAMAASREALARDHDQQKQQQEQALQQQELAATGTTAAAADAPADSFV